MTDRTDWVARRLMSPEDRAKHDGRADFACIDCEGINDQPQSWDMHRGQMWPEWPVCVACMAPFRMPEETAKVD